MQSTPQSFSYLRSKVREWKAGDLLPARREQRWERFQAIATTQLTPTFEKILMVLKMTGRKLACTQYLPFRTSAEMRRGPEA